MQNPSLEQLNALMALYHQGRLAATADQAAALTEASPRSAVLWNILGVASAQIGQTDCAVNAFRRVIELRPNNSAAYSNLGIALKGQGKLDEAIAAYSRALAIKPDYAVAEAAMLHQRYHICDWHGYGQLCSACERLGISTDAVSPFEMLALEDNAERQMLRSQKWARKKYKQASLSLPATPTIRPGRLRIGYFSADLHDHALLHLMAGLLRDHDSTQFEVFAYSYGRSKSGNMRKKAEGEVDQFFDVADLSDPAIVNLARSHALDIAVDLMGYTRHTRSSLFQYRLAPIQMNYLGYPGTMGADFIDYIIADPTVIPNDQRAFYAEKVIYLPNSYQPNDDARRIAQTITTRADFGLPESNFVFCCFNNNYKISPDEFDIWMRLLNQVESSVLWLLKSNKWAEPNLRREAGVRGIDPSRLVFADRQPHSVHLARHKHADLFIDTFNYNAHTTASDALWAGLPVVTKIGQQFAARVAASLLTAVGLPELITTTEAEYEALILDLATNSSKLNEVRAKLETNRLTHPLFDTGGYTRHFERGLQEAYKRYFDGQAPADIWIQ